MLSININELKSAINFDIGTFFKSNNLETPFLIVLNPSDLDKSLYFSVLVGTAASKQVDKYIQTTYRASRVSKFKNEQGVDYYIYTLTKDTVEDVITILKIKGYL